MAKSPTASRGESRSPKQSSKSSPPREDASSDAKPDTVKSESNANASEASKPLAPPPRPGQQQNGNTPDYFTNPPGGSLSLEPNPFEQSFGAPPETPGGTKLPSVAALTSPSSLLPGGGSTPFHWGVGGSLRTGPLSPAMLSGPTNDYFGDTTAHLRGGFPTPNESSLRTGLTPGGSGSMFPAPSPNSQALFSQLQSGGATPSTLDFHRTAIKAAAAAAKADAQGQPPQAVTSQPQELTNGQAAAAAAATAAAATAKPPSDAKPASGPFDPHDNDAANGLFLLAQGRNGAQPPAPYAVAPLQQVHAHPPLPVQQPDTSPQMNGGGSIGSIGSGSGRGVSEAGSAISDDSEPARPNTRAKGKRNGAAADAPVTNGRRKASEPAAKGPASKKSKVNNGAAVVNMSSMDMDSDDDMKIKEDGTKTKMTDEEKRKNFLERNRVAALKCRQRKKQWLANLQTKVEMFSSENDALSAQITQLREEVVNLKTLLLAHKDCPVTQQQGLHNAFMQQSASLDPFPGPPMNPYGLAGGIPAQQPLVAGQVGQRRFS